MAKPSIGVWGIDLGQCGLKAIRLEEKDGQVVATAFDFVEHPKILTQPDADPDQLTREALDKFLARNQLKGDIVAISVPGQSGLARFVKLPPVEEKKIGDIVKFEAKQQIPFNLDEVVWDYQKLGAGIVTDGFALDTEIGLFAMKRDMVNKYLQHFKDVSVDVHVVQMAPLALCNYVAYDLLKQDAGTEGESVKRSAIVALDIGTDASNLVITDGDRIIWQRPIPLGGNHFTRALTKDLKLTFAKAEHLKRNAMKSPELKKILASIKPVLTDFVSEVQRSLGYFTNTHRDVQIQYMVGLGNAFRLPGLQRFLAEKLQLDVRKMDKLQRLKGAGVVDAPVFSENLLSFAVAYGLAVQGLQKAKLLTNLLPGEIRLERLIKAKKPWAIAAAAVLLLSVGALAMGYGSQYAAYNGKPVQDAMKEGDRVLGEVGQWDSRYKKAREDAENEGKAIDSIFSGQQEQVNWLHLTKFLDEAIPRPEDAFSPQKLPATASIYLNDAKEAFQTEWQPWQLGRAGSKGKEDELGPGLNRLIQFNIEAVNCRYSEKLSDFWNHKELATPRDTPRFVLPVSDLKNPPGDSDKGWVVELRGYTYHKDKNVFVINVLMENLVRKAAEKGESWPINLNPPAAPAASGGDAPKPAGAGDQPAAATTRPISHIILANSLPKQADLSTPFYILEKSSVSIVVGGGAGGGKQDGPGGLGGGQGGGWKPLGTEDLAKPTAKAGGQRLERTEFVIYFIWREPTAFSDALLKKPESTNASNSQGGLGIGGPSTGGPGGGKLGP